MYKKVAIMELLLAAGADIEAQRNVSQLILHSPMSHLYFVIITPTQYFHSSPIALILMLGWFHRNNGCLVLVL